MPTRKQIGLRSKEWKGLSRKGKQALALSRSFPSIDAGCRKYGLNPENRNDRRLLLAILADIYIGTRANSLAGRRGPKPRVGKRDQQIVARLKALQEEGAVIPSTLTDSCWSIVAI